MNYQNLTLKELKDLLRDRNIAGRSKATTKEKAIALLEECDRLSAENLPAPVEETPCDRLSAENLPAPVEETPVENFTGSPPAPPAPPTFPEPEPEPENSQPCLSIRQPWAWAIFHLGKDVENRSSWQPPRLGRLYVHASKTYDHAGARWIEKNFGVPVPGPHDLPMGAIVGHVDVVGCTQSASPWAIAGQFHWQISEPVEISPISTPGELGIFYRHIPPDSKSECLKSSLEKAAKLKSLIGEAKAQKINRRERIETSSIQSPSGASVNDCFEETRCSSTSADEAIITQISDENNSDSAERLAKEIWESDLAFIDHNGQPAKRVSLLKAQILAGLSSDSIYRLITLDHSQLIVMSPAGRELPSSATTSPPTSQELPPSATAGQELPPSATAGQASPPARQASPPARQASPPARQASPPTSKFFLSFLSGGGRRFWLGYEDSPTPNPSRAEAYSERHAKTKAAYHRQFSQKFPGIQIFERSHNNQWYEHRLVRAAKSWRERSTYEVIPVNPIDLSPRSPPFTA